MGNKHILELKFNSFLKRCYEVARKDNIDNMTKLSNALGEKYDLFRKKDVNVFSYENLEIFAERYGVNVYWLISGKGAKHKNQSEINSNIHKIFSFFGEIGLKFGNFQKEVSNSVDPDSDGGVEITPTERHNIKSIAETLLKEIQNVLKLAGLELKFDIKVEGD